MRARERMASLEDEAEDANANAADADAAAAAAERSRVEMGAAAEAARAAAEAARAEAEAARADAAEAEARVAAAEARCAEHDQGGGEAPPAIVAAMEASVHRMAELLRARTAEVESLKATVNAECEERIRLLSTITMLQGGAPPTHASPPPPGWVPKGAAALEAGGDAPVHGAGLLSARGEANGVGHVQWGMARQPARRGRHAGGGKWH